VYRIGAGAANSTNPDQSLRAALVEAVRKIRKNAGSEKIFGDAGEGTIPWRQRRFPRCARRADFRGSAE
jgi:hypothetical protein